MGIGTNAPNAKAALEISATDKGLLIPRLTQAQRTALTNVPQGLMVYQTDGTASGGTQTGFWYYAGTPATWVYLSPAPAGDNLGNHSATQDLALNGNDLKLNATADDNNKLAYDATTAGPVLTGGTGGLLGYRASGTTTPVLTWTNVSGNSRVGIGLGSGVSPSRTLDVGGAVRLRNLSTAGVVTTDANGVLSSEANQTLSITGQTLSISGTGGNSVTLPSGGAPTGTAGGDLTGTYPNPTIGTGAVGTTKLADNAVTSTKLADDAVTIPKLAATGTASATTFLRGDNTWATPAGGTPSGTAGGTAGGDLTGTYPNPTLAAGVVATTELADNAVTNAKVADDAIGIAELSATGTPGNTTYLRGDNTWATIPSSSGWSLTGNATNGNEFLGTTNDQDLFFKRNNAEAFRVHANGRVTLGLNTPSSLSVLLGYNAGVANNSAIYNVVVGARAGERINSNNSTFIGYGAGQQTTGASNTLLGFLAGNNLTTGTNNVFIGNSAGYTGANMTGSNNVVIGTGSGSSMTSNTNNILLGGNAQAGTGLYDAYAIGNNATVSQRNSLVIGDVAGQNDAISVGIGTSAPSSSLQVNGTFAVGVVNNWGGGTAGGANGLDQGPINNTTVIGGYYGLAPGTNSNYYLLPDPTTCPGRIYYLRNNSTGTSAFLLTSGGSIYGASSSSAVSSSAGYELRPNAASKTVIAISDGTNWTVGYINQVAGTPHLAY
ncbi:hypothetical protein EJV47_09100 [Hymenobacter gummosus]|uniref:Uncharacterized protein n=1 Tax=Hymenobacter gummosus TaxID=1776032 RepID=A0A3S0HPB2_9BACT|nr:hypothetical protein [Hymenobacter gummosus]RTQ50769.1 hypothetical protein EJV47_09100 [Hymenobacter gummosus]